MGVIKDKFFIFGASMFFVLCEAGVFEKDGFQEETGKIF